MKKSSTMIGGLTATFAAVAVIAGSLGGCTSTSKTPTATQTATKKPTGTATTVPTATATSQYSATPWHTPAGAYIVLIGGEHPAASSVPDVLIAPINANGSIGAWSTGPNSMPTPVGTSGTYATDSMIALHTDGNYLTYVSPSTPNGGGYSSFYPYVNSSLVASGVPGPWTIGTAMDAAAANVFGTTWGGAVTDGSFVYLIDYFNAGACNIYPITAGVVGTVDNLQAGIGTALDQCSVVQSKGYLYVMGGRLGGTIGSTVYTCKVQSPGTLAVAGWTNATDLPITIRRGGQQGQSVNLPSGDYIYQLGGYNGTGTFSTVYYNTVGASGALGTWATTTALPANCEFGASVVYRNATGTFLAVLGGETAYGVATAGVYYAQVNANGTLGAWTSGPAIPSGPLAFASAAVF